MEQALLQFAFGLRDSLNIATCIARYTNPKRDAKFSQTLVKLLLEKNHGNEHTSQIVANTLLILKKAFMFTVIVLVIGWLQTQLEMLIGYLLSITIYWVVVGFIFMDNALQMWVSQQEIGQEVVNMEIMHYENNSFAEYQIDTDQEDDSSALGMIHRSFSRFLFSLLFQVQTNVIAFIVSQYLFFPLNYLVRIPIFALFLSMSQYNTKIPFQQHLTYYYDQHLGYLVGLNLLQSCVLHFAKFPVFTGIQWAIQPFFQLNSIAREPPRIVLRQDQRLWKAVFTILFKSEIDIAAIIEVSDQGVIPRDTYRIHLQGCFNSPEYQLLCEKHKGYMSIPAMLTPHTQRLINQVLTYLDNRNPGKED